MKKSLFISTLIFFLLTFFLFGKDEPSQPNNDSLAKTVYNDYITFYNDFTSLTPDPDKIVEVQDFFMPRDIGTFVLESGKIYFCKPIKGRVIAAVFIGKGTFSFEPPTLVEREQLERYFKVQSYNQEFTSLCMVFGDSTEYDILKDFTVSKNQKIDDEVNKIIKNFMTYTTDSKTKTVMSSISYTFLNNAINELFFVMINQKNNDKVFWSCDPYEDEEVSFLRSTWTAGIGTYMDLINQFHCSKEMEDANYQAVLGSRDKIKIDKYQMEIEISSGLYFKSNTKIYFTVLQDSLHWIDFNLADKLKITKVTDTNNKILKCHKGGSVAWIKLNKILKKGETFSLVLDYDGDIINSYKDITFIEIGSTGWYPINGYRNKAVFDLIYHTPDNFVFTSIGDEISREEKNDVITTKWLTKEPIRNACFNIGHFKTKTLKEEGYPEINVHCATTRMKEYVEEDALNSVKF